MRTWLAVISTAALLAACSNADKAETADGAASSPAAAASGTTPPAPRPGLWEQTVNNPMTGPVTLKICVGPSESGDASFTGPQQSGADCTQSVTPGIGGGATFHTTCNANGMTMISDGKVTGDLASAYKVEVKTKTTGANIPPQMADMTMTIDAKRLGDCPAGVEPNTLVQ